MAALLVAAVAFQLNATMLVPAVNDLQQRLPATPGQVGLALSLFFLSTGILGLFVPRLSDVLGRRRILLLSLIVLAVGSLLAMLAPNIGFLYVARVLQGASGSVVTLGLLILRSTVDRKTFGTLMGVLTAVNGGVAGVDVLAGGALADSVGFRYIFLVTLVVAVIATAMVARWVPESRPSQGEKMDWPGVVLLCIAVAGLAFYLSEGSAYGYATIWMIALLVVSLVGFVAFHRVERRSPIALIPTGLMRQRAFWAIIATTLLTLAGIFGTMNFLLPSLTENAQHGFGFSANHTSIMFLMPYALAGWIIGPLAGAGAPRFGWRRILRLGLVDSLLVTVAMLLWGVTSVWVMFALSIAMGVTYAGMVNILLNGLGVVLSPPSYPGLLPGLNGSAFGIGASIGTALLSAVIGGSASGGAPTLGGYRLALVLAAAITAAALAVSFLLPQPQGEPSTQ